MCKAYFAKVVFRKCRHPRFCLLDLFFFNDTYTICLLIINFVIDIFLVFGSDFGLSKESEYDQKTYSFCGTVEYMAPEVGHIFVGI